ncbi:MAG: hypothetical protein OWR62_11970 [Sulfobacillus thermotolerans]|uniref:Uncharacterized protein n=1 Tax=Sulfobacillus thermotolerans TaxID=338644 RepID=A0ABM6RUA5_9FIRM|nr:hypothetical protein BXT84_13735 [Sulfobacillus thermotolerans]MCY0909093.1 hypothetical protein [Sulfobacillus thermotolerans]
MEWQVFRDQTEQELAERRAFVEQTLQWRILDFGWSAANIKQWYQDRLQWESEIQEAIEFLYRYDYPLRLLEEQVVQTEDWLWNDYDGMRQTLMALENRFWQDAVPIGDAQEKVEIPSDSMTKWWATVRGRRGQRLAVLRSRLPMQKFLDHLAEIARSNDYEVTGLLLDSDHALLELTPLQFVEQLSRVSPSIRDLLPMRMTLEREQGRLSATLTDWIGEAQWPDKPEETVLKALAWIDVTGTIFLDSLGWVR